MSHEPKHRKTPILGVTTCRSERTDKQLWHQRWRTHERTTLAGTSPDALNAHLPLLENQVSNVWAMDKDGHSYWSADRRRELAESMAGRRGRSPQERTALKKRLLHKLMGK